ncbi:SAM-dependent methyltransferase [Streptomyces xanthochromogenes]|uniref:SAM-dependent methyltransferase n=1 Tax=Streptomyces xanthochromogenes TaxID=67384 RepID=UPI0037F25469
MNTQALTVLERARRDAEGRPLLINLYCCQGGSAAGYAAAGFAVVGVDIEPQPRYPYPFIQAGALEFLAAFAGWILEHAALTDASPPCQAYSRAWKIQQRQHPELIGPTRELLAATGRPYVIENVEEAAAELRSPVTLCGAMFGMTTYRHRLLEAGGWQITPPPHPAHTAPLTKMGRPRRPGEFAHYVGNFSGVQEARDDMRMPWASRDGLREAVPPAYTEYIGRQFLAARVKEAAA